MDGPTTSDSSQLHLQQPTLATKPTTSSSSAGGGTSATGAHSGKRTSLSLADKRELCELRLARPEVTVSELARLFSALKGIKVGQSTVCRITQELPKWLQMPDHISDCRRLRGTKCPELEQELISWMHEMERVGVGVTDDMILFHAKRVGPKCNVPHDFGYSRGHGHLPLHCDVSSDDFVTQLHAIVTDHYKRPIDVLVNNAGITMDAQLHKMTVEQFDWVIAVNLRSVFLMTQAFTRDMKPGGSVVNISSIFGRMGNFGQANYCASKAGVIGLTKNAAIELARKQIRVNAVLPGAIVTSMTDKIPDHLRSQLEFMIPMKRLGEPDEIANVCAFLASDQASYVTGACIEVTGGLAA